VTDEQKKAVAAKKAQMQADYDQGLATCREFLIRHGPHTYNELSATFRQMMSREQDEPTRVVGTFALLGLFAAALATYPELESKLEADE
jgi:hypothetical protein